MFLKLSGFCGVKFVNKSLENQGPRFLVANISGLMKTSLNSGSLWFEAYPDRAVAEANPGYA